MAMTAYKYTGMEQSGKTVKGSINAQSQDEAVKLLRQQGIVVTEIAGAQKKKKHKKVKEDQVVVLTRQLSSLVASGIPLVKCISILADQTEHEYLRQVMYTIQKGLEGGDSFADCCAKFPKVFSALFVNMIYVGEYSGNLNNMLEKMAIYLQQSAELNKKIKSAMVYPTSIMVVAGLVLAGLFVFVIPGFKTVFESMGGDLPVPTKLLIAASDIIKKYFILIAAAIAGIIFGYKKYAASEKGQVQLDAFFRKLPAIGPFMLKMNMARFSSTLSILVRSGVPILNAISISGKTTGNPKLIEILDGVRDDVSKGNKMADSLKETGYFPNMLISMIGVGEEAGNLGDMLEKVSDIYNEEVDNAVEALLAMMEPLIMVFLGVVIGGIAVSLFLPILKMSQMG